jgi:hypothetical protein
MRAPAEGPEYAASMESLLSCLLGAAVGPAGRFNVNRTASVFRSERRSMDLPLTMSTRRGAVDAAATEREVVDLEHGGRRGRRSDAACTSRIRVERADGDHLLRRRQMILGADRHRRELREQLQQPPAGFLAQLDHFHRPLSYSCCVPTNR